MPSPNPPPDENAELIRRISRMRKMCDDVGAAIDSSDKQRKSLDQMKRDAADVYKGLKKKVT